MTREIAEDVTVFLVPGCNHWLPEENPEGVLAQLQSFLGKRGLAGIAN
jgi:pimeloyl-ACP methyl ester carboxylesterase